VVEAALAGKTWKGKEDIIAAFPKFVQSAKSLWTQEKVWIQMKAISVREARRTNATYRPHALMALGNLAEVRADPDLTADIMSLVEGVVDDAIMSAHDDGVAVGSSEWAAKQAR
jgi:proteasome component ECM29